MVKMQIELFTSNDCVNCRKLKKILPKLLAEHGLQINDVIERNVEDTSALADLMLLGVEKIPAIRIRSFIISGENAADMAKLNAFLHNALN